MKKILLSVAVIAAFSFTSCKKDRVCTCTTTVNGVAGTASVGTFTKAKKGDARSQCLSSTSTQTVGTTTYVAIKTCTLK